MLSLLETTCSFIVTGCVSYLSVVIIIIVPFFLLTGLVACMYSCTCLSIAVSHETSLAARSKKRWLYFTGCWSYEFSQLFAVKCLLTILFLFLFFFFLCFLSGLGSWLSNRNSSCGSGINIHGLLLLSTEAGGSFTRTPSLEER